MNRRAKLYLCILLSLLCINGYSQLLTADVQYDGLFDNREFKGDMLPQTIYGMRFMPEIGIDYPTREYAHHIIMAGFSKIWEFGAEDRIDPDIILYYKYRGDKWNALFGSIPRDELQRKLPDALLYDSIAFFEPTISGTLFQRHGQYWQTELYCNWFSRQTETQREAFRIVWDGYVSYSPGRGECGLPEYDLIHAGWFVTMTHWAKPKEAGHFIYDQFQFNPYIGFNLYPIIDSDWRVMSNVGLLYSMLRCRKDGDWHKPIGFLGDIQVGWKMLDLKSTVFAGGSQQPFLDEAEAGLKFHRSDPFYNHTFYNRTELGVIFVDDQKVQFGFRWNLHFTPGTPLHNQQLLTVKYRLGTQKPIGKAQ